MSATVRAEARSSGPSVGEKASAAKTASGPSLVKKGGVIVAPPTYNEKEEFGYASTCVVNLLDSSAFEGETTHLKHYRKRASKLRSPDASLVPLGWLIPP
jgi:hypothetical protein